MKSIRWGRGHVELKAHGPKGIRMLSAPRVLITVPLGVLQASGDEYGAIEFIPVLPKAKQNAVQVIAMGKVTRIVLRFREPFWKGLPKSQHRKSRNMAGLSFLFSTMNGFPLGGRQRRRCHCLLGGRHSIRRKDFPTKAIRSSRTRA